MNGRLIRDALVGVTYLVVIGLLIALSVMIFQHDFTRSTTVVLHTGDVGDSLQQGSDVEVRGVIVGEVESITPDGDGAALRLRLDPSKVDNLPANLTAQLLP
jgi:phospholipid/cholesterol/gamma-HCH transport system substrate-binding protein